MRKDIAVAMMTWARSEYLDKALTSLEKCDGADEYDYFFFQDGLMGGPPGKRRGITQRMVARCIDRVKTTSLPVVEHRINKVNRGVSWQINSVFKLFEHYDTLFIFEDDLIVSKWYLRLLKQAAKELPNCVVSFHSIGKEYTGNKNELKILKGAKAPRSWGFNMTKQVWDKFQPIWQQYWYDTYRHGTRTPYYDTTLTRGLRKLKISKYVPLISRAYGVGIEGLTTNLANWEHRGLHTQQKRYQFLPDRRTQGFKLRS